MGPFVWVFCCCFLRQSLYSPGWTRTHYTKQAGLELTCCWDSHLHHHTPLSETAFKGRNHKDPRDRILPATCFRHRLAGHILILRTSSWSWSLGAAFRCQVNVLKTCPETGRRGSTTFGSLVYSHAGLQSAPWNLGSRSMACDARKEQDGLRTQTVLGLGGCGLWVWGGYPLGSACRQTNPSG